MKFLNCRCTNFLGDSIAIGTQTKAILVAESYLEDRRSNLQIGPDICVDYRTEVESGHESTGLIP